MKPLFNHHYSLPTYRYIPGYNEHPHKNLKHNNWNLHENLENDSAIYSYFKRTKDIDFKQLIKALHEDQLYLFGLELFDKAFFWECHEWLECLWAYLGKVQKEHQEKEFLTNIRAFLQGQILYSASGVKLLQGQTELAVQHSERAQELIKKAMVSEQMEEKFYNFHQSWIKALNANKYLKFDTTKLSAENNSLDLELPQIRLATLKGLS